jgi:hypothetical protein
LIRGNEMTVRYCVSPWRPPAHCVVPDSVRAIPRIKHRAPFFLHFTYFTPITSQR